MTNSPDFISKIFAKHYLTALRIVSNTINRSNKHNNNSNVLLVTRALSIKSPIFNTGYGCNTKKMSFFKVHTKNMDLSNFINLILYPDRLLTSFTQDKKLISVKIIFISKFLMKIKGVRFFYIFQVIYDGLFIFTYFKLQ